MRIAKIHLISGAVALSISAAVARAVPSVPGALTDLRMVGDANGDGVTNAADRAIVQANLGKAGNRAAGDADGNGLVNSADLTLTENFLNRRMPGVHVGKVVDTTVNIPNASGQFYLFNAPAVDKAGNLAFLASGTTVNGVYKYTAGAVSRVADSTVAVPSGAGAFDNFSGPTISNNRVMFFGLNASHYGIYTSAGGPVTAVVNKTTPRPEGSTFSAINDPLLGATGMTFIGANGSASGAYAVTTANNWSTSTVTPMVNTATPIPGGTGNFPSIENPILDGQTFYFTSNAGAQYGVYKKVGNTITALVDKNTPIPGTSLKFTRVGSMSADAGNVSFFGRFNGASGVYALIGSAFQRVADTSTAIPGAGDGAKFAGFGASSIGGSSVAFVGYDAAPEPNYGIYAWINGEITKVIDSSVTIGGKLIRSLELNRRGVVGNRVYFQATFADNTSGVFAAALMPTRVPGDVNNDGAVNHADYDVLHANIGGVGGYARGDLNADGLITFEDLQLLESHYGKTGIAPLLGDLDANGKVDRYDLRTVTANLGKRGSAAQGDFNGDGLITFADLQYVEANYGRTAAGTYAPFGAIGAGADVPDFGSVPEPGGVAALAAAAAGMLARRRRR